MLVRFAIETEAIDSSATRAHITRLLDQWELGILVYPRRGDPALWDTISGLAPTARKLWKEAWEKVVKNNGNVYRWVPGHGPAFEWSKIDTPKALASVHHEFEVAVLEESRAAALEVPDGESRHCGKVEGIRLCDVDMSEEFGKSKTLGATSIDIGDSIQDIWSSRFQRFAAHSRQVVVVDQYAVQKTNFDGVRRLLGLLDGDANRCRVTIYSCLDRDGLGADRVERSIRSAAAGLGGSGVAWVDVRLFHQQDFKVPAHDRHLRFDNGVFRIGRGMRIFERLHTTEATDVTLVVLRPGTRDGKEMNLDRSGKMAHGFRVSV
ncbi:MAG: hypothetical protein OXT72_05905 [Gammaproteobacteria bacterium]|nr:hypothetical protein [Gammaproteobacteria bacterium]MDE0246382.1 hypothetical protein [Gammaproteobacteria bacterium]